MSSFGTLFRVTTFGESHCKGVGVIVDGCPPGLSLNEQDVQKQLTRRRPGQSDLTTPRDEKDKVTIYSGTEMGYTLGTPISMMVFNEDQRPRDYGEMDFYPRPSHADWTYLEKYGIKASSGGGRSSARETIGRVAASGVAEKYLREAFGIEIVAFVSSVGHVDMSPPDDPETPGFMDKWKQWWSLLETVDRPQVDKTDVRCPDQGMVEQMRNRILKAKEDKNSIGGCVVCVIRNLPSGLGEPSFDKFEAKLAHAMLSIPATKSFEIGSGLAATRIPGNVHNDAFVFADGKMRTETNFSGGIQGGITNGENVYFKVGFKSVATIGQAQETATYKGAQGVLEAKGRHDPCVLPRAVPIVESMATLVVMEYLI
ncbi:chorismate synthase [Gorgonomyces haynaldii]|nr:chorismate synthase [Gorgonomyces haynaldii]